MKGKNTLKIFLITIFAVCIQNSFAQTSTPITFGLEKPTGIINAGQSSLLVAEAGTFTPNEGRISIVNKTNGIRRTLIKGLPSGISTSGQPAPSGPSGLSLNGRKLFLTIGQGNVVTAGGRGGEVANPKVSSPLFNSVLELTLPPDYEENLSEFTLSLDNQNTLANGGQVQLINNDGKSLNVKLIANLPDHKLERTPRFPQGNVRPSNIFGVTFSGDHLFLVDASFNLVYRVNIDSGQAEVLTVFPPKPNPLPFGPPVYESVPDSIRLVGDKLLVSNLTGFPFPQGAAEVQSVDINSGAREPLLNGLTAAIDVLPIPIPGDNDLYLTLEFSANMLGDPPPPGRLKLYKSATAEPMILNAGLISPTGIARDNATGDIFVTEIFPGRIIRVSGSELAK